MKIKLWKTLNVYTLLTKKKKPSIRITLKNTFGLLTSTTRPNAEQVPFIIINIILFFFKSKSKNLSRTQKGRNGGEEVKK